MQRVGILTLYYKNNNYGGIAQAYAFQLYVNNLGYDAELISYRRTLPPMLIRDDFKKNPFDYMKRRAYRLPQKIILRIENKYAEIRFGRSLKEKIELRAEAFEKSRELVRHSETVYTDETIKDTAEKYDCFVSGSDQIWKPGVIRPAFVCDFLPPDKKRFSYASSIAVTKFPEQYGEFMKNKLKPYCWISVREKDAKSYLEKITGRSVDVVVDPTMLLRRSEWDKVCARRIIHGNYIFVYLLGQSRTQRKLIKKYAKDTGRKIVFLPHVEGHIRACDIGFGDIDLYDVDLSDFFSLIKHADMIVTDSFHAVVFSIIFQKNFAVFERKVLQYGGSMGSRLATLLDSAELSERIIENGDMAVIDRKIDYEKVEKKLQSVTEKSKELLKQALLM